MGDSPCGMFITSQNCLLLERCMTSFSIWTSSSWTGDILILYGICSEFGDIFPRGKYDLNSQDGWRLLSLTGRNFYCPKLKLILPARSPYSWRRTSRTGASLPFCQSMITANWVFFSCWLTGSVFAGGSTAVRPETFLMTVEMAWGRQYSINFPYLARAYGLMSISR